MTVDLLKRIHGRWSCVPLAFAFYLRRQTLSRPCIRVRGRALVFQTKFAQAVALIARLATVFAQVPILVVTDSWFGNAGLLKSLRAACGPQSASAPARIEAPEGVVYCGGGAVKLQIEYSILEQPADKWDARVTVNGETRRAMTAHSFFGKSKPPRGFVVALLGEDRSEFLVFKDGDQDWLEFGDYTYRKCN